MKRINFQIKGNMVEILKTVSFYVIRARPKPCSQIRTWSEKNSRLWSLANIFDARWSRNRRWTNDPVLSDELYIRLWCNASCITERREPRNFSLWGIHPTREIALPRAKRNGLRRFYYTALKPGRLPLQSYRSKLAPFTAPTNEPL